MAPITFAPNSPLELALLAKVPERRKRLHRPAVMKRLAIGADEFKRRAEAKALGKIIDKKHSQYHVSYGMMLGIYCSVVGSSSEAMATLGRLHLDDLMAVRKLVFAPGGSSLTPPHPLPRAFKFKDYAPNVFHSLRERFSIDQTAYLQSLGGACEYIEFSSNSKSGSFFFYSHDGKFMIKTQSKRESKFLRRILAHYYQHIMTNPLTYLTRFYGMHRIKMPHLSKTIYFVVMQSVFYGDVAMTRMYDIKVRACACGSALCAVRARAHSCALPHPPLPPHTRLSPLSPPRAPRAPPLGALPLPRRRRPPCPCSRTWTCSLPRRPATLRWAQSAARPSWRSSRQTPPSWSACRSWTTRCCWASPRCRRAGGRRARRGRLPQAAA